MSEYDQVVSNQGYIIHAVTSGRQRHGLFSQFVGGTTLCRKLRGRDSTGFPDLRLQFDGPASGGAVKPFSRDPEDFDLSLHGGRKICDDCCRIVLADIA